MHDDDLRDLFAGLALVSKAWVPSNHEEHARHCYQIADAMIAARRPEPEDGIASVIAKRKKPKGETS